MSVVKNLLVRVGMDSSELKKGMDKASRDLKNFSQTTNRSLKDINGKKGFGGLTDLTKSLSKVSGNATKSLGELAMGLEGLTAASIGAGASLGPVGLAIGALVAVSAAAVAGIGAMSQRAVKFESDLKRVNLALGESTTQYMGWAKSMGLSKLTASQLGGTYGILLSSFVSGNQELEKSTEQIVQATRVVASATGRTLDDTFERIRSGLLGNTEAIEDLGIFVNVSMIESTNAFKKFANGKHWNQLDYRVQQQIRLQAILEQAQARYGSSLQDSVMTKQQMLVEQLKDVKLNLSQAFLPIWEKVLPALSDLAGALAAVTEHAARFSYMIAGKNYDEATKGTNKQSKAVTNLGDSYQTAGEQAKNALASFDEIHQIGDFAAGNTGSGPSTPGGNGPDNNTPGSNPFNFNLPDIPPLPKLQLKFDPPDPPDAGIGAVATAVNSTVNEMAQQLKLSQEGMWSDLALQTLNGRLAQEAEWGKLTGNIGGALVPEFAGGTVTAWNNMLGQLQLNTAVNTGAIQANWNAFDASLMADTVLTNQTVANSWKNTLNGMQGDLAVHNPLYMNQWDLLQNKIYQTVPPLMDVKKTWQEVLEDMQAKLKASMPVFIPNFVLIGTTILALKPVLIDVDLTWTKALENMYKTVKEKAGSIITEIESVITTWARMQAALSGAPIPNLVPIPKPSPSPAPAPAINPDTGRAQWVDDLPVIGGAYAAADWFRDNVSKPIGDAFGPLIVPGASFAGAGSAFSAGASKAGSLIGDFLNSLKNLNIPIPQFAAGGIVDHPMIAQIGEAGKEMVVPLENTSFVDTLASALGTAVMTAMQTNNAGNNSRPSGDIALQIDGVTFARLLHPYTSKETTRVGGNMITTT